MDADQVIIGRIGKPFGVNGDVYVFVDPDLAEPLAVGVSCTTDRGQHVVVTRVRDHAGRVVAAFDGHLGRAGAESLRGQILMRPRTDISLEDGSIWIADLQGRQVVDGSGDLVGVVETITDGHAHDFLVVARPDGGQALIPLVEEMVDYSGEVIVVTPPEGLLDLDRAL